MLPAKSILKNIGFVPPTVDQCYDHAVEFYAHAFKMSMQNIDARSNKIFWLSFLLSQKDDEFLNNTHIISWVNKSKNTKLPEDKKQRTTTTDSRVLFSGRATSRGFDVNDCAKSLGEEEEFTDMATIVHELTASASLVGCGDEVVATVFSCVRRCVFLWKLRWKDRRGAGQIYRPITLFLFAHYGSRQAARYFEAAPSLPPRRGGGQGGC